MARVSPAENSFIGGEFSPRCFGRTDIDRWSSALKDLFNFTVQPQGGVTRRMGTYFGGPARDDLNMTAGAIVLVPFQFSTTQAYMLEFGVGYVRFFSNNGRVVETGHSITAFLAGTVTATAHGLTTGDWVVISGLVLVSVGMTDTPVNGEWKVTVLDANNFQIIGYSGAGTYSSGGTVNRIYQITTPYGAADLDALQFNQSADELFVSHIAYPFASVNRLAPVNWTYGPVTFLDGPYLSENKTAVTMTASGAGPGTITVTASAATFAATDVGRMIRIRNGTTAIGWGTITAFSSATSVTVNAINTGASTTSFAFPTAATKTWRLGSFSATTGYPAVSGFYQSRLVLGRTTNEPQTVWASVSADIFNMQPTNETLVVGDSNAFSYALLANKVDAICWLDGGPSLLIGTVGAVWEMAPSSTSQVLSPTNVKVTRQTADGSQLNVAQNRISSALLFVQRGGRKVRELLYNYADNDYDSKDITILSEHLPRINGGIKQVSFQQEPDPTLWCVCNNGALLALTYLKEQNVAAWSRHSIGGNGKVISIATIPGNVNGEDQVWLAVSRTINNKARTYIEYMSPSFQPASDTDMSGAFFVDCGLTYQGTAVSEISGLNHLEGQTVSILADGAVHPSKVVVNGKAALQKPASLVYAGLPYTSYLSTVPFEAGGNRGTAQAKIKRVFRVGLRFFYTLGGFVGPDMVTEDQYEEIVYRNDEDPLGSPPPLFTGDKKEDLAGDWGFDSPIFVWQSQPLPMTVLALFPEMTVNE